MNIQLPVYIQEQESDSYVLRPLFATDPWVHGRKLRQAITKLIAVVRTYVRSDEQSTEDRLNVLCAPEDWAERHVKCRVDLRRSSTKVNRTVIVVDGFDRQIAFLPSQPELWFEVDRNKSLNECVADVLTRHFRKYEKRWGADAAKEALAVGDKSWTTIVEMDIALPVPDWKRTQPPIGLSLIFGGRSFSGAEELEKVGRCINHMFPADLVRAVERENEVTELKRLIESPDRSPMLLVGPPKVGKTAVLHEYVYRRVEERGSPYQARRNVWLLSPQRLIAGMSYVGEWEERLLAIIKEAKARSHTLYFDDLLGLFFAGKTSNSSLTVGQVLKPYIERREVRIVGEITQEAFHVLQERDRAFADLFHLIPVKEPTDAGTMRVLVNAARRLEEKHKCRFDVEVLPMVKQLQEQYIRDQAFPGKAAVFLELLAENREEKSIERQDVLNGFHEKTGLALQLIDERTRLSRRAISDKLSTRVMGQKPAIQAMAEAVSMAKARLNDPSKPLACFLFLGPTGVGKTECAKALAEYILDDEAKLTRFDMNEFVGPDAVARLVGTFYAPDGLLTAAIRRNPFCILLLDEIEKAHRDVFPLLLQVMGEGRLTDALGRIADFSNAIIILTSNLGSRQAGRQFGFTSNKSSRKANYLKAVEDFFAPEFVNRIDRIIPFRELSRDEIGRVAGLLIHKVITREGLARRKSILNISPDALDRVVDMGYKPELGARALKRAIEQQFTAPVARRLAAIPAGTPAIIRVHSGEDGIDLQVAPLTAAESRRWPQIDEFFADPNELIVRTQRFLERIEDEVEEFAPEGAVGAEQVGSDEDLYFLIKDLCRKVSDWLREFNIELRPDPRRKKWSPRARRELPIDIVVEANELDIPLFNAMLNAGEVQRFANKVAPREWVEATAHEGRVLSVMREVALINALNDALFDEDDERFIFLIQDAGSGLITDAQLDALVERYAELFSMVELAVGDAIAGAGYRAIPLHGRHAGPLIAQERGACVILEGNAIPVRIESAPADEDCEAAAAALSSANENIAPGPVRRVHGRTGATCDFAASAIIPGKAGAVELRRMLLSSLTLPPELTEGLT